MNDKHSRKTIAIAGLRGCGKTSAICGLLELGKTKGVKIAGFKPFETGLIKRNATETPSDAEIICKVMSGEPMETLVTPYVSHEDYPIELSFRRDGININWGLVDQRITLLNDLYDFTLVECPGSLFAPIIETKMVHEWLVDLNAPILWLIDPVQDQFEHNLAEMRLLLTLDVPIYFVLNNASKTTDQDLIFYIWEKIEASMKLQAGGMIPHIKSLDRDYAQLAEKMEINIPTVIQPLFHLE